MLLEWNCAALSLSSLLTSSDHAPLVSCFHNCVWSELHSIWGPLLQLRMEFLRWVHSDCWPATTPQDKNTILPSDTLHREIETAWLGHLLTKNHALPLILSLLYNCAQHSRLHLPQLLLLVSFILYIHCPGTKLQFKHIHQRLIMNMAQWSSQFHKLNCSEKSPKSWYILEDIYICSKKFSRKEKELESSLIISKNLQDLIWFTK